MAMFHAAQALILARDGTAPKTHAGVRARFGQISLSDPHLGGEMGRLLREAYQMKEVADYLADRHLDEQAVRTMIARAIDFIDRVARSLDS